MEIVGYSAYSASHWIQLIGHLKTNSFLVNSTAVHRVFDDNGISLIKWLFSIGFKGKQKVIKDMLKMEDPWL